MKIAVCTPHYGDVTAGYAFSLATMLVRMAKTPVEYNGTVTAPETNLFLATSSVLPQLRNVLYAQAVEWGANYLLWVDADQTFPEDALLRLLSLNLPVVGANYPRRVAPHQPTAVGLDGQLVWTTEELADERKVEQVQSLGFGFCLMDMHVIEGMRAEQREQGEEKPLFAVEMVGDGTRIIGEDVYFFRQLREAGIPVHVDHALSWTVGHVHSRVLTNDHVAPLGSAGAGGTKGQF
jgi:hypothetical protein